MGSQVSEEKSAGWTGPLRHGQVWGGVREREKRLLVTDSAWERHSLHCAENLTCTLTCTHCLWDLSHQNPFELKGKNSFIYSLELTSLEY